ncbi:MAG: hypothetical protein ACHQ52_05105 [Candidatus Eisenbacteria bacterium]
MRLIQGPARHHPRRWLAALTALAIATRAHADLDPVVEPTGLAAPARAAATRAGHFSTTLIGVDPDTVYIGHVVGATSLPGTPGGDGPWHVGRGNNRVMGRFGPHDANNNGYWDWDRFNPGEIDSLQGWWPLNRGIGTTGGVTVSDLQRSSHGLDYGNLGCYAINQGSPKRTFGVVGYWHRDPGANVPGLPDTGTVVPGPGVEWVPLDGGYSAWCGLRAPGDLTVTDPVTGNPVNADVVERASSMTPGVLTGALSPEGTDRNFPGYGSQWDQMLYRDIEVPNGSGLDLSFRWSTHMDTRAVTAPDVRIGWFDRDPLKAPTPFDGNFISSTDAGATAPVDSFMVYIGAPVVEYSCVYSDGNPRGVYDPLRRWFSEVIAIDHPYAELLSVAGVHENQGFSVSLPGGPGTLVQDIIDSQGIGDLGYVRLVFRVKTNRGFDDGDYGVRRDFSSGTAGAAIVDDVIANGWDPSFGDFEAPDAIDDLAPTSSAWHATGKPPGIYFHVHDVSTLPFADPCGATTSPSRTCDLVGHVVTPGDHDHQERPGGTTGTAFQDRHDLLGSPTVNLCSNGPGDYNGQGIDRDIADAADIQLVLDLFTGGLKGSVDGNYWQVGWQSWPARQANGASGWGEIRFPSVVSSYTGTQCLTVISRGARFDDGIVTTNASGVPDSMRVYLQHVTRCFALPLSAGDCSPAGGRDAGIHFDNLSLAFIHAATPPALSVVPWDLFTDAFPSTADTTLFNALLPYGGLAFDTCAAQVRTARNTAPSDGLARLAVPGDTAVVSAPGSGIRVDLVFRILPGPGDYVVIGDRGSGVAQSPDVFPRVAASPGDGSFWGTYMADDGVFGTGAPMDGVTPGVPHPDDSWDPNVWNSARCDTAELNLFPESGHGNVAALTPGRWASMLHEQDPKIATLGIPKPRCFLISPTPGTPVDASNITCGGGAYPPAWALAPGSGLDPAELPGLPGWTREYTKIIPDGLLTAGSHVEYFFRRSDLATPSVGWLAPDTMRIVPQPWMDDLDGHRWQEFSVLPDRWKDPAYGGAGMACMLFVDWSDRRGDEMDWVAAMDTVGGTRPERWGAHNGWHARGDQDPRRGVDPMNGGDPDMAVRAHLGQPGTMWDMFQVRGAESGGTSVSLGDRLAASGGAGLDAGRLATNGPIGAVLRAFYRTLVLDTGDLGAGGAALLGPYAEHTDGDIALLEDFVTAPAGTALPRSVWALGRNLAESLEGTHGHPGFLGSYFGATLRSGDFRALTGSATPVVDLVPDPLLDVSGRVYGLGNSCTLDNDVLDLAPGTPGAAIASRLQDPGAAGSPPPWINGVWAPASATHPHRSLFEAWRLRNQGSRYTQSRGGLMLLMLASLSQLFADVNCVALSAPVGVGDQPGGGHPWGDHLALGSANPMRGGEARIVFGLVHTEQARVEVYDVSGRRIRTLADRLFAGGVEHRLVWDGTDSAGRSVNPGVYFYRIVTPSFHSERKLTLLRP